MTSNRIFKEDKLDKLDPNFSNYFRVECEIALEGENSKNDELFLWFYIYFKDSNIFVDAFRIDREFNFYVESIKDIYYREDEYRYKRFYNFILPQCYAYLYNADQIKFKETLKKFTDYSKNYLEIKNKTIFENKLKEIMSNQKKLLVLGDQEKIQFFPLLSKDCVRYRIRQGSKKDYSVKTLKSFFNKFENKEIVKYGKELVLTHDLNLFDKKSQKLIKYLMGTHVEENINNVDNILNEGKLFEIFKIYQNDYILFNDGIKSNHYLSRLNKFKPIIKIDEEFNLSILSNKNFQFLFDNYNYVLLLDELVVDIIDYNENILMLIRLILSYSKANIKDFLEEFKYSFYLSNQNAFLIDDKILPLFNFDDILIKVYFDIENGEISYKTKLYLENKDLEFDYLNEYQKRIYNSFLGILESYGFKDDKLNKPDDVFNFLNSDLSNLKKLAEVYLSNALNKTRSIKFNAPKLNIKYKNNLVDVVFEESNFDAATLEAILKSIKKKKQFILLDGNYIYLPSDESKKFIEDVHNFNFKNNNLLETKSLPLYYAFKVNKENTENDLYLKNMITSIKNFKNLDIKIPKLNLPLREYQEEGFKYLKTIESFELGAILADDMGLGKTIQVIALLKDYKNELPSLIIAPTSLIFNWKHEFKKFANIEIKEIYGNKEEREKIMKNIRSDKKDIFITSYDTLRNDIDLYKDIHFGYAILDEGQYIKNAQALKTISVKKINATNRLVLTGTPIENNILDIWSIFDYLMPGYFNDLVTFKSSYEDDSDYISYIRKKIQPFILRRNKKEVLKDLPDKYETLITSSFNEEELLIYEAIRKQARDLLNTNNAKFSLLSLLTKLRQICISPSLVTDSYKKESSKINKLLEIIEDKIFNKHRILVFSQFVKALDLVKEKLNEKNIKYEIITGSTKSEDRIDISNKFNNSNEIKVLLISLKAGGVGLNLIGADTVIHLDPWWNIAATNQATDRAYRIGQTKNVEVIKLITNNSIEQRVIELQNIKKDLIDKLISENDESITNLSIEDLSFIIS